MTQQRRDFLRLLSMASTGFAAAVHAAELAPEPSQPHGMSNLPANWYGTEQIAMLLYPGFTALDLVGPQHMFGSLLGAKVHLVAQTLDPVKSESGLAIKPTLTLAKCPRDLDILFIPGGGDGTLRAMQDKRLVYWIADRGARARLVSSVCVGSLLLGQAGLLRGKRATSHWATRDLLTAFGATPVAQRVVWDGKLVTGSGVSAGLDLGLSIVGKLRDDEYAQSVQLLAEYAPEPPYRSGTPEMATQKVNALVGGMFDEFRDQVRSTAKNALPRAAG
jgi:cyclohexyl-isocyanide hydratase